MKKKKSDCREAEEAIVTDPFGSYTGRPADREDVPVQDADDL